MDLSGLVAEERFERQTDRVFDTIADLTRNGARNLADALTSIGDSFTTAVLAVTGNATVGGDLSVSNTVDVAGMLTAGGFATDGPATFATTTATALDVDGGGLSYDPATRVVSIGTPTALTPAALSIYSNALGPLQTTRVTGGGSSSWTQYLYSESSFGPTIGSFLARGTPEAPQAILSGKHFLQVVGRGETGAGGVQSGRIYFTSTEDWSPSGSGSAMSFFTTPNQTISAVRSMVIQQDGNVGIGVGNTGSANTRLHVQGASGLDGATPVGLTIKSSNNGTWVDEAILAQLLFDSADTTGMAGTRAAIKLYADSTDGADNGLSFWTTTNGSTGLSERMRIDHNGSVSLRSDDPVLMIDDSDATTRSASIGLNTAGGAWTIQNNNDFVIKNTHVASAITTGSYLLLGRSTGAAVLGTSGSERLRIDGAGNVGIGTTNPSSFKLQVDGNVGPAANVSYNLGSTALRWGCVWTSDGSTGTCASDERLKDHIEDLDYGNALAKVVGLHPRTFTFRADPTQNLTLGLIAQEVTEVAPELVVTDPETGLGAVRYGALPWLVLAGLQELAAKVSSLADTVSGFASAFSSDQLTARIRFCIDDLCITKEEFRELLDLRSHGSSDNLMPESFEPAQPTEADAPEDDVSELDEGPDVAVDPPVVDAPSSVPSQHLEPLPAE